MYSYNFVQWMFIFYFYCFVGWCIESAYVSIMSRKPVNRGFMRGPFLPLYGSGAVMMLLVSSPFQDNLFLVFIAGCVGATVLEYITGVTMETLFKIRYWDYSDQPFNFQGHVCLGTSLAWGGLTILMTRFVHKPVEMLVLAIPTKALNAATLLLTIYIVSDFAISFKAAMDLKNILIKMEKAKEEMVRIQKRLDDLITATGEGLSSRKAAFTESVGQQKDVIVQKLHIDELRKNIEEKLESLKEKIRRKPTEYSDETKEELIELHTQYRVSEEKRNLFGSLKNFAQRNMIRSNPTMNSQKYKEAFEELRQKSRRKGAELAAQEKKDKKDNKKNKGKT